ncbi:MAG: hypothetical protein R3191_00520 [Anaerolineales bacterium]|nr:hypothetical protein [Anaerolineales bacterium]
MELIVLTISTGVALRLLLPATALLALGTWIGRRRNRIHSSGR